MKKKLRVVKRAGTIKPLDIPVYPKRYEIVIERGEGSKVTITRTCTAMTSWELYGVLRMCLLEIERQMLIKPGEELRLPDPPKV